MADLRLSIADFTIDIVNHSAYSVSLEGGYVPFLTQDYSEPASVVVNAHTGIPTSLKTENKPIYTADFEGNRLWQIAKVGSTLVFHVFNPEAPFELQQGAELNEEMNVWNVYSIVQEKDGTESLFPLLYPMGPLVMYYLTVKYDAVMIHGSGISDKGLGRIFTGVSGQGKTTTAKLWFESGADVINDDRIIIRKQNGVYHMYNTPMFYEDKPRSAKLAGIYSIYHLDKNLLETLSGVESVSAVMPNLIQHGYASSIIAHHLGFINEMVKNVTVYKLGFLPTSAVVQTVKAHKGE
ncbi:MAG: hypothetical protein ACPGD8_00245 [Flavobacteriales bacterium]